MKKLTFLVVFVVSAFISFPSTITAVSVILQDDFSQDLSKWVVARNQCQNSDWTVSNGLLRIFISETSPCVTELVPANWDNGVKDYSIELDMKIISGTDKNIAWRYKNSAEWIGLHVQGTTPIVQRSQVISSSNIKPIINGNTYRFIIEIKDRTSTIKYFNKLTPSDISTITALAPLGYFESGSPALQASVGADPTSKVEFDNVKVSYLDKRLPVDHQSQKDPAWSMNVYDSATSWASPSEQFIKNWGCAMTSMSMSLDYYGAHSTPTGAPTNPGNLNQYLLDSGGYTPQGYVIWKYITNYVADGKTSGVLPASMPDLEVDVLNYSQEVVDTDYQNLSPTILRTRNSYGTHFVLGIGSYDNQVFIHDPLDLSDTFATLAAKYPTPDRAIRIRPSDGELRSLSVYQYTTNVYPQVVVNSAATGFMPTGIVEQIPHSFAETNTGIGNPDPSPITENTGTHQLISIANATEPVYVLQLTSDEPTTSSSQVVGLNQDGQASQSTIETLVLPSAPVVLEISGLDQEQLEIEKQVSIDSLLAELDYFENQGQIFRSAYVRIRTNLRLAEQYLQKGRVSNAKKAIERAVEATTSSRSEFIDAATKQYLHEQLQLLASSL